MTLRHKIVLVYLAIMIMFALPAISQVDQDDYKETIESADKYFNKGDYINAKASYQLAVKLAPEEQYPKERLKQSLDMIRIQDYQTNLYTQEIQIADNLFRNKDFALALQYYQEALSILPGNVYASGKIQEINRYHAIDEQIEADFQKTIILAGKYIDEGKLNQALIEYRYACTLKPYDMYAKEKAIETKSLIAWNKNIPDEYQASLLAADLAILRRSFEEAIKQLEKAITLKPDESLPKQKLAEAHSMKTAWDSYDSIIISADEDYGNLYFVQAKDKYLQAQFIKPDDDYPNRMLEKIDIELMEFSNETPIQPDEASPKDKIMEIEALPADAKITTDDKQQALENDNTKHVDEFIADTVGKTLQSKDYEKALAEYQSALALKPGEQYVQGKVLEIKTIMTDQAKQLEIDQQYVKIIATADEYLKDSNYADARTAYQQQKLNQVSDQLIIKRQRVQQEYDLTIIRADKYFASKTYDNALDSYRAASLLIPEEEYPRIMANHILKLLIERSIVQINKDPVIIPNNTTHKFDFTPVPAGDRKSNYIFFRARNLSKKEFKLIVSFGEGQSKNGGIIVKVPASDGNIEFVVRISAQYKWFSDDNNWITCFPEGGDIEVSFMQISYSD